jgi:hypothetical protein
MSRYVASRHQKQPPPRTRVSVLVSAKDDMGKVNTQSKIERITVFMEHGKAWLRNADSQK